MVKIGIVGAGNVGATAALYAAQKELGDIEGSWAGIF